MAVMTVFLFRLFVFVQFILITTSQDNDIAFNEMPLNIDEKITKIVPVSRLWGVPDTYAVVGKLFSLAVPKKAFKGDIDYYEVR